MEEINYDELAALRANTMLDPISIIRIEKIKEEYEKIRNWYYKVEGELIESDYTEANKLEYALRFKIWESKCAPIWKKHPDGLGLSEYAKMALEQCVEKEKKNKTKKYYKNVSRY